MMIVESCSTTAADVAEKITDLFSPGQIDQFVRQAVQYCWVTLPKERRTAQELEKQIRRLVDRALKDFREDQKAFGRSL